MKDIFFEIIKIFCTWFGSGFIRPAPGTWGTLATLPVPILIVMWLNFTPLALIFLIFVTVVLCLIAIPCCTYYMNKTGGEDNPEIVIDEVAGMLITIIIGSKWLILGYAISPFLSFGLLILAFGLFRLFDITKPLFIGFADRNVEGGLGVMLDDILAGISAGIVFYLGSWLLLRLL